MKKSLSKSLGLWLMIAAFAWHPVYSQQAKIGALQIKPSSLIEDLIKFRSANPTAPVEDLVKTANSMLDKQGLNYAFVFDENTCRLIDQARKKQKNSKEPLNLTAGLNSVGGEKASLILPEERYEKSECGRCAIYLPVWEATARDFVTFIHGINVKFHLPTNFYINEVALLDERNPTTVVTRWKIPFRAEPLSISDDGKILYLPLPARELSDLALMIFDEGVIQFYERKKVEPNKKANALGESPQNPANSQLSYMSFEKDNVKQIIRYHKPCTE